MNRLSQFIVKRYKAVLLLSVLLFALTVLAVANLSVSSNMEDMLPSDSEAMRAGKEFDQYFDSQDNALVVVQGDGTLCRQYLQELEKTLLTGNLNGRFLYRLDREELKNHALLYLERSWYEKLEKAMAAADQTAIGKLLEEASRDGSGDPYEYLQNDAGDTYLMVVKPLLEKDDFIGSRQKFYDGLQKAIGDTLALPDYHGLKAGLTGGAFIQDIEADSVAFNGFASTFAVTLLIIILLLVVSYRKIVLPVSFIYPLMLGTLSAAAVAWLLYGSLNMFSVSFALLLIGLGIDYAIHLITRYYEERSHGVPMAEASMTSVRETGVGILYGAVTTSLAFLAFLLARFKAFAQMGVISSVGILILCLLMILIVPALIQVLDKRKASSALKSTEFRFLGSLGSAVTRRPWIVMLAMAAIAVLLISPVLKTKVIGDIDKIYPSNMPCKAWEKVLSDAFGYSPNVLTFMVENEQELAECTAALEGQEGVQKVESALDYLPEDQDYKLSVIERLRGLLSALGYPVNPALDADRMTVGELPEAIRTQYLGKDGRLLVEVVPSINVYQQSHYEMVKNIILKAGGNHPVGMPAIMNEVVSMVQRDVILISIVCFSAILVFLLLSFRSLSGTLICAIPLAFTLYATLGILPVIGTEINIFSVASFPLIIGIGIDSSIHLLHRLRSEPDKPVREVLMHTGKAITLTTLTTLLGFGSLAFINHPGMANLGVTVSIGVAISLIATLTFIPAAHVLIKKKTEQD